MCEECQIKLFKLDNLIIDNEFCVDTFTNANQFNDAEVAGCGEEVCPRFKSSPKGKDVDEVGEPPKRGEVEKVGDGFNLAKADLFCKTKMFTDLHGCFDEKVNGVFDGKVLVSGPIWDIDSNFVVELKVKDVDFILDYVLVVDNSSKLKNVWMLEENNKDFLIDDEMVGNCFVDNIFYFENIVNPCQKCKSTVVNKATYNVEMVAYEATLKGETYLQIYPFVPNLFCETWKVNLLEGFDLQRVDVKCSKLEKFMDTHYMTVQNILKSNFEISYVVYQWLGLFSLMVIVKVCEVIVWMSEKDQCDQHIDVI